VPGRLHPAFPQRHLLPWVLGGVSVAAVLYGVVADNEGALLAGSVGLAGVLIAYPLAWLVAGREGDGGEE
jgi:hypothetical protein